MNEEKIPMYIVSECWYGSKHTISLSNRPDFEDQEVERVILVRRRPIIEEEPG